MLLALAGPFRLAVVAVRPSLVWRMLELVKPLVGETLVVTPGSEACGAPLLDRVVAEVVPWRL
jgi:hypothetical protein